MAWTALFVMAGCCLGFASPDDIDWKKERLFWAFRPPALSEPRVKNREWVREPLDYFVLAGLEGKGLKPSPEAPRQSWIRRVTFDLTGLPPTPAEVAEFLPDKRKDAFARVVDRLLASPRFGERMASLWLPLARYGEDQAHQVGDDTKLFYPNAYKYREWLIRAFNRDLPYDAFIRLQLAADKFSPGSNDEAALGFLGLGPKYYNRNRLEVMADEWEDRVDTVTRTFLGLTVACARCHDHKFDPITREDYYAMAGVFASTRMVNKSGAGNDKAEKAEKMDPATLHLVEDDQPQDLNIFVRGNVERKGPMVPRRFIQILEDNGPAPFREGSGRRELAEAIASANNPLTARVMANRLWSMVFGQPIVGTPSNFGHSGEKPFDQGLLDFIALRFIDRAWSVKSLVREMVLSATYRQDSHAVEAGVARDAANQLLWRMNRRRLTVEQWRDALLFVSGELEFDGGKSMELDDPKNLRRTVYGRVSRLQLNSFLMQFDYPDANVHAEKRSVTTTAMQKLFALNSRFMEERAEALSRRLVASAPNDAARVQRAYRLLFARAADERELKVALDFLARPGIPGSTRWQQYAQALLASNEMNYVD